MGVVRCVYERVGVVRCVYECVGVVKCVYECVGVVRCVYECVGVVRWSLRPHQSIFKGVKAQRGVAKVQRGVGMNEAGEYTFRNFLDT